MPPTSHNLSPQADGSSLIGGSVPVEKQIDPPGTGTIATGHTNVLFNGTAVARSSGGGVVSASGMAKALGRISSLLSKD